MSLMELNVTYIVLDGYVDVEKHRVLYFLLFLSAFVVIILSNSTVVCLICFHRNLHEPMYFFIAALLLNSVIFSSASYPKILLDVLSERQAVTYSACLFQWYMLYAVGGSEFWILMVMAYDRYLAICKPLQYAALMTKARVNVLLAVAWTVPALLIAITVSVSAQRTLCSFISRGIFCSSTIYKLHCVQFTALKKWSLFVLMSLVFIPVIFTCFTYIRIFTMANRRGVGVRKKAMSTCLPHLVVLFNYFCLGSFDVLLAHFEDEFPKLGRFLMSLQLILYQPIFSPFIYGLKMKKISAHLKRMFCAASKPSDQSEKQ